MTTATRWSLWAGLTAAVWVLAAHGQARAQQADGASAASADGPSGTLRLGKIYTYGGGVDLQHGWGMDARYALYPDAQLDGYMGVFAQGQYETGDAWRFAGGLSGGWGFFGLELGFAHRTATDGFAGSTGLHIGQSFTFGPVSVGARLTVPLVDHVPENVAAAPGVQGLEGALTVRLSWGFTVHGQRRQHSCHGH